MSGNGDDRFNLVFAGERLPDTSEAAARRALAAFFGVADPNAMAPFFTGRAVPLRRNLTQRDALRYYRDLRGLGLLCAIEAVEPAPAATATADSEQLPSHAAAPPPAQPTAPDGGLALDLLDRVPRGGPGTPRQRSALRAGPVPSPGAAADRRAAADAPADAPAAQPAPAADREPRPAAAAATRESVHPVRAESRRPTPDRARPTGAAARDRAAPAAGAAPPPAAAGTGTAPMAGLGPCGPAPNFFALRPALGALDCRQLKREAEARAWIGLLVAFGVLLVCAGLLWRFPVPAPPSAAGPEAAASARGQLFLLADNALHRHGRSGRGLQTIEAAELGFSDIAGPLWFDRRTRLVLRARQTAGAPLTLWRCALEALQCTPLLDTPAAAAVTSVAGSIASDELFAVREGGELLRLGADGEVLARRSLPPEFAAQRLLSGGGLLYVPATEGPMLGVFRPDQQVFGEQLDALLLMPPEALTRQHTQILDVAALDGGFWVIMGSATGDRALYRFDADWQAQQSSDLDAGFTAPYLVTWQDRLLVADPSQRALLRYAADGREEAALRPELLDARWQQWRNAQGLAERGRAAAIAAALLLCLPTLAYALLQGLLYRYLPAQRLTATAILDPIPAGVHWVPPHAGRRRQLRNLATLLVLLPTVMAALLYLGSGDSAALAALPALGGALIAARLLRRGLGGYCGLLPERLIAVDFDGRYCFGTRDRLRGNDHTLLFGQVAVPLRISGLDNLDSQPLSRPGAPLHIPSPSPAGEIAAQMLLQRHPWALAALWLSGGWIATLVLLTAAALLS